LRQALVAVADAWPLLRPAAAERGPGVELGDAAFLGDGLNLTATARETLTELATLLRAHPGRHVYVQAHTDAGAGELQRQRLSELRAEAVRSVLVQAGVEPDRIHAIGYGGARPVADGRTSQGRERNRRVEIVLGSGLDVARR
jgi:outer membrane protein OmpA-like peptidoglycan-associated protein